VHRILELSRLTPLAKGSLADGDAGVALLFAYASLHEQSAKLAGTAECLLESSMEALASGPRGLGLFESFAGLGFAIEHLHERVLTVDPEVNDALDEAVLEVLRAEARPYDLAKGLVGYGLYALERAPRGASLECLEKIVAALASQARRQGDGCAWFTPAEGLSVPMRSAYPAGLYDLGVPHGTPGVIGFLGRASAKKIPGAASLLDQAVRWVLARKEPDAHGAFPRCVAEGALRRVKNGRTWCYGDPGVGLSLLVASKAAAGDWEPSALEVLREAADRCAASPPSDMGLCCGSGGLGHIFNRAYHFTREEPFARAARTLLAHAVEGVQRALATGDSAQPRNVGLLSGLGGTALALLAASSEIEPAWDRVLLLSS
jgi:hypothetical protein